MDISIVVMSLFFFFFNDTATTEIYTLSLHDALPISSRAAPSTRSRRRRSCCGRARSPPSRSEEHTSELQSPCNLVCRLLLEKKKKIMVRTSIYLISLPLLMWVSVAYVIESLTVVRTL